MAEMLELSAALPEVTCPRDEVLIREGEVHGRLFVLVEGELEVTRAGTRITVVDAPGAIFGEMSALLGSTATGTDRALHDSRISRSDDPVFLDAHPRAARAVATTFAAARHDQRVLVDLRRQCGDNDNLGMVDPVLECATTRSARYEPGIGGSSTRLTRHSTCESPPCTLRRRLRGGTALVGRLP